MKNIKLMSLSIGLIILVGVLFVWMNEQERKPVAAATPLASPLPYITPSPIPTRDPALVPASFYTVDEVWAQAESLNGHRVAVRGHTHLIDKNVTWECIDNCDGVCGYEVFIRLVLKGENHMLGIDTLTCEARNCCTATCSLTCAPFDPRGTIAWELVGTVVVYWQANQIAEIHLTDVDTVASSRLVASSAGTTLEAMARLPIESGRFSFPRNLLPQPGFLLTPAPTPEPVTLYSYLTQDVASLDPQWAVDKVSQDYVENLFVQLTNYDVMTGEIVPDAAASWQINSTATVYTFTLHPDIPWVNHDPSVPGTTQVADESGQPRFVTAQDFVYGIRRLCDPPNKTLGARLVVPLLKGCAAARAYPSLTEIPPQVWQAIGVTALDTHILVIELTEPSAQFLAMTSLSVLSAVPQWLIEDKEWGEHWTESGTIVTSGQFVLTEWVHNVRMTLLRNPLFPPDLAGRGNIAQISTILVQDHTIGYALWLKGQVELATIPVEELDRHLMQYDQETDILWDGTFFYWAFDTTRPPFNDIRIRRAFNAALDRNEFGQVQLSPIHSFTAYPSTQVDAADAPPMMGIGVDFDPEYARAQLAAAGYPDCENFPTIGIHYWAGSGGSAVVDTVLAQWALHLGCSEEQLTIFTCGLQEIGASSCGLTLSNLDRPHLLMTGWGADYPEGQSWLVDSLFLSCLAGRPYARQTCQTVDDWIAAARTTPDPIQRQTLYHQIEAAFFNPDGEFPIIPLFARAVYVARHEWLTYTYNPYGAQPWYNWSVEVEKQAAARLP